MTDNETFRTTVGGMVDKLEGLTNKDEIVGLLQDIDYLILDYKIVVDNDFIIYPIWVEAYYYNEDVFDDMSCHINNTEDIRGNVPPQFEFRKHKVGHGGVDLYLGKPDKDYYLSFLIKLALIKEGNGDSKLYSQTIIVETIEKYLDNKELRESLDTLKLTFIETDLNTSELRKAKCKRVRLSDNNNDDNDNDTKFNEMKLAACYDEEKPRCYDTLKGKTDLYVLKEY